MSLAPKYGVDRIRARVAVELAKRHYEAATPGRRTNNWNRNFLDSDAALRGASATLRNHARDLMRNNGWAKRARSVIANNTVGAGIMPKAVGAPEAVNQAAMALWKLWGATVECESDNRQTFYGIQRLAMKHLVTDGEVLVRRRMRKLRDGLTVPMQLQVLEADYINTAWNALTSDAGGPIIQGVEFDKLGRRAAYWLFSQHPGSGRQVDAAKRVPAEDIIHLYDVERAGQTRGVSWLAAAIVNLKDLDEYDDAELVKQKIAACFAAFVTDTDGAATPIGDVDDDGDDSIEELQPGMVHQLPPGKTIVTASPPSLTGDALPMRVLRKFAAGIGVTYEDLTADYSNVNFSSGRMGRLAHQSQVTAWQQDMLVPILCMGVWDWVMGAAVDFGLLSEAPKSEWTTPALPMLEPDKEGLALARMVRGGFKTQSEAIREQGYDPDAFFAEYAADMAKIDSLKLIFDSDPRNTTQAGQEQPSVTAINSPTPPAKATAPPAERDSDLGKIMTALNQWAEDQRKRNTA